MKMHGTTVKKIFVLLFQYFVPERLRCYYILIEANVSWKR